MGEATNPPEENKSADPDEYIEEEEDDYDMEEELEDLTAEELAAIDSKLDALNQALDVMETKNDHIHEQLMELLKSSREIRQELKHEQSTTNVDRKAV